MTQGSSPYIQMIQDCEAAIARIRMAIRSGSGNTESVGAEWEFIRASVTPRLIGRARRIAWVSPLAQEEAFTAMIDRLFDDVWSLTYLSMETKFGRYLVDMPTLIIRKVSGKYLDPTTSLRIERLDEPVGEEGRLRHEAVGDPQAAATVERWEDQRALYEAIRQLPSPERQVIRWRLDEVDNNEIAERLGISRAGATRIYQRAVDLLQGILNEDME